MRHPAIAIILSTFMAFLASSCLWGVVIDADTGGAVSGATVSYTDADGHNRSTTTDSHGIYAFDLTVGPQPPAVGSASFDV